MATIASLAVKLIANPSGLVVGLKAAETAVKHFQSSALNPGMWAKKASEGLGFVQSAVDGIVGPVKSLLSSIPLIGASFGQMPTSLGAFVSMITESLSKMKMMVIGAQKLGVSLDTLGGIEVIAGAKAEDMQRAMFHLAATIGELNRGSPAAIEKMLAFGFAADAFKDKSMDQGLGVVMDKIKGTADWFQKAAIAKELFGRKGVDLLPILNRGSAALAEATKKARELGLSFSTLDAAGIMKAKSAMKQIELTVEGMKRSLAIEMAPIIAIIADNFSSWLKSIGGVRGAFHGLADFVATFLGNVVATMGQMVVVMEKIDRQIGRIDSGANAGQKILSAWTFGISDLGFNKDAVGTEGFGAISESLMTMADQLKKTSQWWANLKTTANQGAEELPNAAILETVKKVMDLEQSLNASVAAYGRNSQQVALNKLAYEGATPAILKAAQARIIELEMLDKITNAAGMGINIYEDYKAKVDTLKAAFQQGMISAEGFEGAMRKINIAGRETVAAKALDVFKSTQTPIEAMQDKIAELNVMLQRGAIDWVTYSRAVGGAVKPIMDLVNAQHLQLSGAARFGSQEAYKIVHQNSLAGKEAKGGWQKLEAAIKQQTQILQRLQRDNDDIARRARDGFLAVGRI